MNLEEELEVEKIQSQDPAVFEAMLAEKKRQQSEYVILANI